MSALRGPGDFTPDDPDDRIECRAEELETEIADDRERVLALDVEQSELLDGTQYEAIFTALADLFDVPTDRLIGSDALAATLRQARTCAAMREQAIVDAALEQAERESADWPTWRGTQAATQHHAQMRYAAHVARYGDDA